MKRNIETLQCYEPDLDAAPVRLDANESPVDFLPAYLDEIVEGLKSLPLNRYPDPSCLALRKAYGAYCGLPYENIVCGNGSDEVIRLLLTCYVDKGDRIIIHNPTFSMYAITCQVVGGETVPVPCLGSGMEIDVESIIRAANEHNAKMIFLCNPNNPTGSILTEAQIFDILKSTRGIVVVDEAYYEFYGETVAPSVLTQDRLVVLRTMSKAFGLAGLRVGFGLAGDDVMALFKKATSPYHLNAFSQMAARVYLRHEEHMRANVRAIVDERERLLSSLRELPSVTVYPSQANFIYLKADVPAIREKAKGKIALRYFGDYLRITVGTKEENDQVLTLLRQV